LGITGVTAGIIAGHGIADTHGLNDSDVTSSLFQQHHCHIVAVCRAGAEPDPGLRGRHGRPSAPGETMAG
jgi:hypothetical protein